MENTKITRRNLAKGAAWATPVILATATVPAYAASASTCKPETTELFSNFTINQFFGNTENGFPEKGQPGPTFYRAFRWVGTLTKTDGTNFTSGQVSFVLNLPTTEFFRFQETDGWAVTSDGSTANYIGPDANSIQLPPIAYDFDGADYNKVNWDEMTSSPENFQKIASTPGNLISNPETSLTFTDATASEVNCYTISGSSTDDQTTHDVEIDY